MIKVKAAHLIADILVNIMTGALPLGKVVHGCVMCAQSVPLSPKSEQQLPSTKQLRTTRSLLPSSFYTVTTTATGGGGGGGVTVCGEGDKPHAVRTNELPTAPPAIVAEVTTTSYYPNGLNSHSLPFLVSLTWSQYICTGN